MTSSARALQADRRRPRLAPMLLLAVALAVAPPAAYPHALLNRSDPAPGAVIPVDHPPRRLSLWFTELVSVDRNAVVLLDGEGRRVGPSIAHIEAADPMRITVDPGRLPAGAYSVRWRVTSADNHVVRGTYWFVVGFAPTPPPVASLLGSGPPPVPMLETAGRWIGLLATLGLAGAPFFTLLVLWPAVKSGPARLGTDHGLASGGTRSAPLVLAGLLLVGQILGATAQIEAVAEAGVPHALDAETIRVVLLGSRFAVLWWARSLLGLTLAGLLVLTARGDRTALGRWLVRCAVCVGVSLLLCTALAGHAVGGRGPRFVAVASDLVHLTAGAVWLGGLVQLLLWFRALPDGHGLLMALVPRFSKIALASVLTLLATGALNTYAQSASLATLVQTAYGQSLLLKLALLLPLLGVAAINRRSLRPRRAVGDASTGTPLPRRFRNRVGAEILLGVGLLLVVGLLGSLPPPGPTMVPSPVEMARQAGPLRVTLRVDPNWVGISRFRVTLADPQGTPPIDVRQVTMTFAMEGMNMGRTHVVPTARGDGVYETEGFYVGMPGVSQIGIGISRRDAPDTGAAFRIEVPDVNAAQLSGLRASLASTLRARASESNAMRGREVYARQCSVCHGESGTGKGPAAPSLQPPPADLTLHARWHADEQLFWFITHGVAGTSMIGFADRLDSGDRHDVIAHLRVLAAAPSASPARGAPPVGPLPAPASTPPVDAPDVSRSASAATARQGAEASPSLTGRLVFGPDFDNDLWVVRLPNGKPAPITRFSPLEFSSHPAWSPDGKRIAFSYYRLPGGDSIPVPDGTDLYMVNADGRGLRPLVTHDVSGAAFLYPAWSRDGATVYVTYVRQGGVALGIDRVELQTGVRTRVVADGDFPALSADGRRLAYVRSAPSPARGQSLWWSGADGSNAREIVAANAFDKLFGVRFAPDTKRLLFAAVGQPADSARPASGRPSPFELLGRVAQPALALANGDLWELWTVDLDGRNLRALTALGEDLPVGAWSPDGKHVAFLGGGSARTAEAGLTVIRADGSSPLRLTTQPGHRGLDWAPDAAASRNVVKSSARPRP